MITRAKIVFDRTIRDRVVQPCGKHGECIECGMCDTECKALEIDHLSVWKDLRTAASAEGLKPVGI